MKIALTADVHLNSKNKVRINNLEQIIKRLVQQKILHLIIAGDLLDNDINSYIDMDNLAGKYKELNISIIPGNHDSTLNQKKFGADNIKVYSKPEVLHINNSIFLLLPYSNGETMGGMIEKTGLSDSLPENKWILISHGDYGAIDRNRSGNESGYFPLAQNDLREFKPARVVLGHIHSPGSSDDRVVYCGSPYPLNINETGQRSIIILDTNTGVLNRFYLDFTPVHLVKDIFVIPDGNEKTQIKEHLENYLFSEERIYQGSDFYKNLIMRVNLHGYSTTREKIDEYITNLLEKKGAAVEKIELDSLQFSDDENLASIALKTRDIIEKFEFNIPEIRVEMHENEVIQNEILKQAYSMIYRQSK